MVCEVHSQIISHFFLILYVFAEGFWLVQVVERAVEHIILEIIEKLYAWKVDYGVLKGEARI